MNKFVEAMNREDNITLTENGAYTHKHTSSALLDLFAMGAAMRNRSDADIITMFRKAFNENPVYALKCLFYIRDIRGGGQGERRFFKTVMKDLATYDTDAARRNLKSIPEFGRWDDLYTFVDTPLEKDALEFMKEQFYLDVGCKTPSLLGKWLKSENTSSKESRRLGNLTRAYFGLPHREYRQALSHLREKINIVERLMSEGRWDEIEFDKIPSKAGLKYRNAFARHDIERAKNEKVQTYADFAKDINTKVNAKDLYPYEVVEQAIKLMGWKFSWRTNDVALDNTDRLMINKYWDNLTNYFNEKTFNGMAIVDTSGSMTGTPINVAISLGLYCASKAKGPFANHFISFESNPHWIAIEGVDFCDKVYNITGTPWRGSTNIEAAFDMILQTAIDNKLLQTDLPENLIIISDMEFDNCVSCGERSTLRWGNWRPVKHTVFETLEKRFAEHGYKMPKLVFWCVDSRHNNIPMIEKDGISFVSGFSPVIFEMLMSGKTGYDLMMDKLDSDRYSIIA